MEGDYPDTSRPSPRPTRLPVRWLKGCLPGEKRPGRGVDQPPLLASTSVTDRTITVPPGSVWRVTGQPDFYINKFVGLHICYFPALFAPEYCHSVLILLNLCLLLIYRTIISPVVLYGCETWSLALRGESKLRVFENMVLRRIFGPRRDEVTGEWRRLHNEEINDLYSSPNIVRVIK